MMDYAEVQQFRDGYKALETARAKLAEAVMNAAGERKLGADMLFEAIAAVATVIATTPDILLAAQRRKIIGDPPGKGDSHGDQIIWESLLAAVPAETALHVISKDGDYASNFDGSEPKPSLSIEWMHAKNADLHLHEELRPFLNAHFAHIKLATDIEKLAAIDRLESTGYFAETHLAVETLEPLRVTLTWTDADRLLRAGLSNSQIRWIGTDPDINAFYSFLIDTFANNLTSERRAELVEAFPTTPA